MMGRASTVHSYPSGLEALRCPTARSPERSSSIPNALLFHRNRDFTALEIRVWSLLDSGSAVEVREIADKLGVHRGSVSRALAHLVSHGFARRKTLQYRNPRTGHYDVLVYSALDGSQAPGEAGSQNGHESSGRENSGRRGDLGHL